MSEIQYFPPQSLQKKNFPSGVLLNTFMTLVIFFGRESRHFLMLMLVVIKKI